MAAAKPEVLISQLLDKVDPKFQMLNPHCRGTASQWSCCKHCGIKPEVRNKTWRPEQQVILYQLKVELETKFEIL